MLKKDLIIELERTRDAVGDLRSQLKAKAERLKKSEDENESMKAQLVCRDTVVSLIDNRLVSRYPEPCQSTSYDYPHGMTNQQETMPVYPEEYHWLQDVVSRLRYEEPPTVTTLRGW